MHRIQKEIKVNKIGDSIVMAVMGKIGKRAEKGFKEYGTTMDREDLTQLQWLTHAQEEAMDMVVYLEKLIQREHKK